MREEHIWAAFLATPLGASTSETERQMARLRIPLETHEPSVRLYQALVMLYRGCLDRKQLETLLAADEAGTGKHDGLVALPAGTHVARVKLARVPVARVLEQKRNSDD